MTPKVEKESSQEMQSTSTKPRSKQLVALLLFVLAIALVSWHNSAGSGEGLPGHAGEWSRTHAALAKRNGAKWQAVVVLNGSVGVSGLVNFTQCGLGPVKVTGKITGLTPNAQRGIHIHEFGDLSGGCASTGTHYNPFNQTHGALTDKVRHVGDLGNIQSDASGVATLDFEDWILSLHGPWSIVGRGLVVHNGTDDLGHGNNADSKKTGNSGGRSACGVIGLSSFTE